MRTMAVIIAIIFGIALGYYFGFGTFQKVAVDISVGVVTFEAVYDCADGKKMGAQFGEQFAIVELDEGHRFELGQDFRFLGARYSNEDNSIVFTTRGRSAELTASGQVLYEECRALEIHER